MFQPCKVSGLCTNFVERHEQRRKTRFRAGAQRINEDWWVANKPKVLERFEDWLISG
jgi:hypothetical protein